MAFLQKRIERLLKDKEAMWQLYLEFYHSETHSNVTDFAVWLLKKLLKEEKYGKAYKAQR